MHETIKTFLVFITALAATVSCIAVASCASHSDERYVAIYHESDHP